MKKKNKKDDWTSEGEASFSNSPFAGLRAEKPNAEPEKSPEVSDLRAAEPPTTQCLTPRKVVLRYERKGRGGKAVTIVEQLSEDAEQLRLWCAKLKKHLGCGGVVEDHTIVIQGDQRPRLAALFEQVGVKKISK